MTNPDDDIAAGQQPDIGLGATFQGQVFPYQGPVERRRLRGATRSDPGFALTIRLEPRAAPICWTFTAERGRLSSLLRNVFQSNVFLRRLHNGFNYLNAEPLGQESRTALEKIEVQPMQTGPRKPAIAADSARLKSLGERYPGFDRIGFA